MRLRCLALSFACFLFANSAQAQSPAWQFRWEKGQTLNYRVQHVTQVAEIVGGNRVATSSKLNLTKRWTVLDVDAKGVATLQLVLAQMRNEQTRPSGETVLFDSTDPEKTTPALKDMAKFVGTPLNVLKIDPQGRVLEVVQGQKGKYDVDPPFDLVLPTVVPTQGQAWQRVYDISLDPPAGTGEKFATIQRYDVKQLTDKQATLAVSTQLKSPPESQRDMLPLVQKLVQGEVIFDIALGRLTSAHLTIERTLQNHQGEGSSYQFHSEYTEELTK